MPQKIDLVLRLRDSSKDTLVILKDDSVSEMTNKEAFSMVGCLVITICNAEVRTNEHMLSYTRTIIKDPKEIAELRSHEYGMVGFPLLAIIKFDTPVKKSSGCKFCWERLVDHPPENVKSSRCKSDNVLLFMSRRYIPVEMMWALESNLRVWYQQLMKIYQEALLKHSNIRSVYLMQYSTLQSTLSALRFKTESSLLKGQMQQKYRTMTYNILHDKFEEKKELTGSTITQPSITGNKL